LPQALARRAARAAHPRGALPGLASSEPRARAERRRAAREQAPGDLPRRESAPGAAPRRARSNALLTKDRERSKFSPMKYSSRIKPSSYVKANAAEVIRELG